MENTYTHISFPFRATIIEARKNKSTGEINFIGEKEKIDAVTGTIMNIVEIPSEGEFLLLDSQKRVRLDKIVTLYGIPGPAYDKQSGLPGFS